MSISELRGKKCNDSHFFCNDSHFYRLYGFSLTIKGLKVLVGMYLHTYSVTIPIFLLLWSLVFYIFLSL